MALNKNETSRLRKVLKSLDQVLDGLHGAQGLLYPEGLRPYRDRIANLIKAAEALQRQIQGELPKTARKGQPAGGAEPDDGEVFEGDVEEGQDGRRLAGE